MKVQHVTNRGSETVVDVHVAEYNGLNWRTKKYRDTSSSAPDGLDQERLLYYSASWQLLEERIDDAFLEDVSIIRHMHYVWGIRYIDDIICRQENSNFSNDSSGITYESTYYHLTDDQFSTLAIVDGSANVLERVSYDAYGNPRQHRKSDLNGEGSTGTDDYLIVINNWGNPGKGDLTRNGVVNTDDLLAVNNDWAAAIAKGKLTATSSGGGTDNIVGFSGYLYDQEIMAYRVRFRSYDVALGRWIERDPLGYVDGMNFNEYCGGMPLIAMDPSGRIFNIIAGGIGAAIGGVIGGIAGYINDPDGGLDGILQGAAAGAVGGFVAGTTFNPALGGYVAAGILSGAAGGFAGSFTNQAINHDFRGLPVDWRNLE